MKILENWTPPAGMISSSEARYSLAAHGEQTHGAQRPLEHRPRHYASVEAVEVAQRRGEAEPPPVDLGSNLPEDKTADKTIRMLRIHATCMHCVFMCGGCWCRLVLAAQYLLLAGSPTSFNSSCEKGKRYLRKV